MWMALSEHHTCPHNCASGRPAGLASRIALRPSSDISALKPGSHLRGGASPDGVEFRVRIGAGGRLGERALRPAGCLIEGTGLAEHAGHLGLDFGSQIRRGVIAQHQRRPPAQILKPEIDGRITDPLDDDGRSGDDLCAAGTFPSDPASRLLIAIRAHGNAAEYIPALIVLFLLVGARSPAAVAIPLIAGATAARVVHAYGLLTAPSLAAVTKGRLVGAMGTYVFGVALAVAAAFSL